MDKINQINQAIAEYFAKNLSVDTVPAKDLMPIFVERGIFEKDQRKGKPIRVILRQLDENDALHKIPSVEVQRKAKNRYWFFVRR